jgi:glycosyltransferase involved in cell wall biosynthesis
MRILTVSAFFESHGGGIELVAGNLTRALARRGHSCSLAAAALDPPPQDPAFASLPLTAADPLEKLFGLPMPLPSPRAIARLWRAVRDHDAVVIHDALYATSLIALAAARRSRKPVALIQHIGTIPYRNPLLKFAMWLADRLVTRQVLRRAAHPVFISDTVRRQFADLRFRAPPMLLFNGVDAERFRPAANTAEREQLRAGLGASADERLILFVGRMVEKKGLLAVREIAARKPGYRFVLVGSGPIDPQSWGLANVTPLGKLPPERLAELYRAADALILPSVGEGYPLVVQEAMASGVPVLCGMDSAEADPGASQFLHGLEVDPDDPDGTVARFCAVLESLPPGGDAAAASYARQTYDWDANAERIEAMLISR